MVFDMERSWITLVSSLFQLPLRVLQGVCHQLARFIFIPKLWVMDLRTFRFYGVQIEHNAIRAIDFKKMSPLGVTAGAAEHWAHGLTVLDPGFRNTAVRQSHITFM
jgi:hypothetical protein